MKLQITVEGMTYEVEVEVLEEDEATAPANYGTYPPAATAFESAQPQALPSEFGAGWGDSEKVCRSPITGLVIKINAEVGQSVEVGDLLMVLEAMKMETNVTAPGSGKVKCVSVAVGDPVKANQVIAEFE